ncbi:MAG: ATP phosphoribosyltransferase [Pseudomonadota bacterium]|nr:ATP phosphoribosyltransferase [Pseudomonadota bacterium]
MKIALSKGRIFEEAIPLLARVGIEPQEDPARSRRLILATNHPDVTLVVIRATDVPTYVAYGAADVGVAGKDVLMEYEGDGLYEPLDLGIGQCRMVTAGRVDAPTPKGRLRIATKYVNTTRRFFATRGQQVEIIKLYGSMELAPLVGLADQIVDLVDTGNTLRANGLVEFERIADISSRLVVNKAAMKVKHAEIAGFINDLRIALGGEMALSMNEVPAK